MQFPGRTLDELDNMNLPRFLRAMEARNIESLEETVEQVKTGKMKGSELDKETWDRIKEHDAIWEAFISQNETHG